MDARRAEIAAAVAAARAEREMEEAITELEARLEEADDHIGRMEADKSSNQKLIRDLEEQ